MGPAPASREAFAMASFVPGAILPFPLRRKWARAPSRAASMGYHPSVTLEKKKKNVTDREARDRFNSCAKAGRGSPRC